MNRFLYLALLPLLALSLALTGCDTSEDDRPAEERLRGTWRASNVSVRIASPLGAIPVPILETGDEGSISISFDTDNEFVFAVRGPLSAEAPVLGSFPLLGEGEGTSNAGAYEVMEDDEQVQFTITETNDQTVPATTIEVDFDFQGDDAFTFSVDNSEEGRAALAFLLGDAFPAETFDQIEGGEARFERSN